MGEFGDVKELFCILVMVVATQLYIFVKTGRNVY